MCEKKQGCQKADNPTDRPDQCSPEQIKKCHGDAEEHPCEKGCKGE